jgi:hypothetical protein
MEMQRQAMLMYTSCGWFFDELSGIETVQVMQYAGRAVQLARELFGVDLEYSFKARLSKAKANLADHKDGSHVYEKFVKPAMVDIRRVAAHYAISSLLRDYGESEKICSYSVKKEDYQEIPSGATKLAVGSVTVSSDITLHAETVSFCSLYLGGHVFTGGVETFPGDGAYQRMKQDMVAAYERGEIADIIRLMDSYFGVDTYSLVHIFRDEQRKMLRLVISETMEQFEHSYRLLYENSRTLMVFLDEAGMPVPKAFQTAAEFTLNLDLNNAFSGEAIDEDRIRGIIAEINRLQVPLDVVSLEFMLRRKGEEMIRKLGAAPEDVSLLSKFGVFMGIVRSLPVEVNYWQVQNSYIGIERAVYRGFLERARGGDAVASQWVELFRSAGESLFFNTKAVLPDA